TEDNQPTTSGCATCDLEGLEDLVCTAKKFARQAEVMNSVAADLEGYKTQFGDARQKYSDARETSQADIDAIQEILDQREEQLKCRLTPKQRDCLEKGCGDVFKEIDECTGPRGCCLTPCEEKVGSEQSRHDAPAQQSQQTNQGTPTKPSPEDELA